MYAKLIRVLAGATVAVAAISITLAVPPAARATLTPPGACVRTVGIDPQVTAAEDTATLTFTVHSAGCAAAGTVGFTATDGTAHHPADFVPSSGILHWSAGEQSVRTIVVTLAADTVAEADLEDFTVRLVSPSPGITLLADTGQGRILDDDRGLTATTIDGQNCPSTGGVSGPSGPVAYPCNWRQEDTIWLRLVRNNAAIATSVRLDTVSDTAVEGVDFVGMHGVVGFDAGVLTVFLPIRITSHATAGMRFTAAISAPSQGTIVGGPAIITVIG